MTTRTLCGTALASLFLISVGCDSAADEEPAANCKGAKCDDGEGEDAEADGASEEERALAAMARFEGVRSSAISEAEPGFIDFSKLDLTRRGVLTINGFFPPLSDAEGHDVPQADLFNIRFELSPAQFETLFGLGAESATLAEPEFDSFVYEQRAEAQPLPEGGRIVTLHWHNGSDEDTRRAQLDLEIDPFGDIIKVHLAKQAKQSCLFGSCDWDVVLDDELADPQRRQSGLALRTDGQQLGRAQTRDEILSAVQDPSVENFERIVAAQ